MSLETGKKLGLTASIITILTPVILVVVYAVAIVQLFAALLSYSSNSSPALANSFMPGLMVGAGILGAIALAGFVLFLVSMYILSKYYNAREIFWNVFKAFLINIITGAILSVVLVLVTFFSGFNLISSAIGGSSSTDFMTAIYGFLAIVVVLVVVVYIISIYCGLLYKRAFDALADKSGVGEFKTMGLLYFIGAILPSVGIIISWIGWIFAALGYNKLKVAPPPPESYPSDVPPQTDSYSSSQPAQATKSCSHCGAENVLDANYCCVCGSQMP
ncbi:MAG: DUF996 domain-containing protein [Candidatus Bathyarchaeota archaeon]|nr:DUF996 domain-containing protein [Candidatus Termitimicrobium sp.]